jgi:DNA modification methylase
MMTNRRTNFKTERELQETILQEKRKGTSDLEIGQKYGVTFRYIERVITRSEGLNVSALKVSKKITKFHPKDFKEEQTTVWSFRQRGNWATHSGEYRGNWSPYIPRNVILRYSKPGELVLDYFCGAGTTAVECKLLGRRCIALDINDKAIELAEKNVNFHIESHQLNFVSEESHLEVYEPELKVGDARDLSFLQDNSIDLICAHPPYANIIHYTDFKEGDLSFFDTSDFLKEMSKVARESFRVLKPGRQCAILIGDTRRKKHIIPLGFKLINVYLDAGFKLRELIIKRQHNCKTTGFWYDNSIKYNFLLLAHEYLPIFEKPKSPVPMCTEGRKANHSLIVSTLENITPCERLNRLETTTVWILPEKDFEERLNKNVIDRYSDEGAYLTITFDSCTNKDIEFYKTKEKKENNIRLLFIKSPFLNDNPSHPNSEHYLMEMKDIVEQELPNINGGGFLVVQTKDVRIDGYIEPLAKKIVDLLEYDNLWLKEIVVVAYEGTNLSPSTAAEYLKTVHQYLLVYEVKK